MDDELYYLSLFIGIIFLWFLVFILIYPLSLVLSIIDFIFRFFNKIYKMITGCF